MRCKHCGQVHSKKCIFERDNSIKVLQFFIVTYISLSRFNELYYKFPSEESYNSFALFNNFLDSKEIREVYKEEYIDILLLVIDNLEIDSLPKNLIFGSEEYNEYFVDDSTFIRENKVYKDNYRYLRERFSISEEYLESRKGKRIFELLDDVENKEKITWQLVWELIKSL